MPKPLYDLTYEENAIAKNKHVEWTEECFKVFEALNELCVSAPILAFADLSKPFWLHTDASTRGLVAGLYQEQNEKDQVIAYGSHALTRVRPDTQLTNYSS